MGVANAFSWKYSVYGHSLHRAPLLRDTRRTDVVVWHSDAVGILRADLRAVEGQHSFLLAGGGLVLLGIPCVLLPLPGRVFRDRGLLFLRGHVCRRNLRAAVAGAAGVHERGDITRPAACALCRAAL